MLFQWKYSGMVLGLLSSTFVSLSTMLVSLLNGFHPYTKSTWRFVATAIPAYIIACIICARSRRKRKIQKDNQANQTENGSSETNNQQDDDTNNSIIPLIWPPNNRERIQNIILLMLRSFFGCSAVLLQYYSLNYMTLADSSTVSYSSPVFVSILAYFFLDEPLGFFGFFTSILTLAGVVCITRPPFLTGEELNLNLVIGVSLALTCTIFRGVAIIIVRSLFKSIKQSCHSSLTLCLLMGFGSWGTLQSLMLAWHFHVLEVPVEEMDIFLAVGMGLLSCSGQICLVLALKAENAGPISLVRSSDIVFSFFWQMIFLHHMPDLYSILGGSIVLCGVLLAAFRKYIDSLDADHIHKKWFSFVLK